MRSPKSRPVRTLLGVALAVGAATSTLLVPGVAGAALPNHATVEDRVGDAPAAIDIKRATYSITRQRATFSTAIRDVNNKTFVAFEIWPLMDAWDRIAIRRVDGRTVARVFFVDNSLESSNKPVPHRVACPGLEVSWQPVRNRVAAVVPARCLQASQPSAHPFEFHTFTRLGDRRDTLPKVTLDY